MRKQVLSIFLSVCMVLTLLPTVALAAATTASKGDFMVTSAEDDTVYSNGVLTFSTAGTYTVAMASGKSSTSNVIKVTAEGVTLNLNGVVIEAPPSGSYQVQDGATALTATSGTVTLNVIADSSLTGGIGYSSVMDSGKGGAGISGNVTVMGTAALTATGGAGGSINGGTGGEGGAGVNGNVTVTEDATLTATGGKGGSAAEGTGGSGGAGISGNVTVTGAATLTATGGAAGAGYYNGRAGFGIKGDVDVSGTATLIASSGSGMAGMAISNAGGNVGGTITVGEDHIVKVGDNATAAAGCPPLPHNQLTNLSSLYIIVTPPSDALPTAAEYAAASPTAASSTDYVLDDTAKTLTIKTAKGAAWWSAYGDRYLDYAVYLDNDIDVSAFLWTPVGRTSGSAFAGSFDGQGHTITGLTVKIEAGDETIFAGLFGEFCGSAKNVGLINVSIVTSNTSTNNKLVYAGALAGDVFRGDAFEGTISNCFVRGGSVSAASRSGSYAGGLVGYAGQKTAIRNCYSTANVAAAGMQGCNGGVIGMLSSGTVDQCYYVNMPAPSGTNLGLGTKLTDAQMKAVSGTENALVDRLNTWVEQQDSIDYYTWQADSGTTNGGYPVFDAKRTAPKAQWGVAGSDGSTPISWTTGTLADAVEYANERSSGTAYIQLLEHVNIIATLEFDEDKTTVLDLKGKTIDGSSIPTSSSDYNVLTVNGNLTLCDTSSANVTEQGKITGGHGGGEGTGGGVYVDSSGTFIMTGGNITGNTAVNGGGVANAGTFTMSGGSIAGNSCISGSGDVLTGGGVANLGSFNMSGGSITGNTVDSGGAGGGVLTNEGMTLSGNVNISGNTVGTASSDIALMPYSGHTPYIYITGALTNSTAIGVSIVEMTRDNVFIPKAGIFTAGDTVTNSAYLSKFVSDNSRFAVIAADDSQLKLAAAQAITKTAATNGSFTVKVNGNEAPSAIEGQTVTVTPTANTNYELDTISVYKTGETSTTVTVANRSFTMPEYAVTVSVTFKVASAPAPAPGGGTIPSPTGAPVIVDGKTVNIGTEKKAGDATTVTVDQSKLGTNISGAASGSSVVVPVSENSSATASLVVKNIEDMAQKGMTLTVQTGSVAYNLNTAAIDTAALAAAFPGADMSTVPFNVTISNSSVRVESETLVLPPVAFTVTATYGGKAVDVDTFSAYIDRVIEVTKEQAAKITTAVVVSADGSVRHVPTNVIEKDGKYYAVVSSRTNSTYALIQNEVAFADTEGKWYEAAVNEMGSRKIIAGRSADLFDGGASITRAEFAVILVRALGLPADGISSFADVPDDAWYTGAVATAAQYGIVSGKGNNQFDPNANITRQEAMLMLQRAAALTEFTGAVGNLDSFADADSIGAWARDAAKWSVGSGLIQGSDGKLNPIADITRAESATIILRLLQKAELVDVRSET